METQNKLVSVIIPTYSRPSNLLRAIDSVRKQNYKPKEIIVVDDNGEGTPFQIETRKLLSDLIDRDIIRYIAHNVNKNGSAARNTGYRNSKGEYIVFFDDDDEMSDNYLQSHVSNLEQHPEWDAVFCDNIRPYLRRNQKFNNVISSECIIMEKMLQGKLFFNTSTVMFRRLPVGEIGGWDESFNRHQDYEFYMRFFKNYKLGKTEDIHVIKYDSENVVTRNPAKIYEYRKKFLDTFSDDINRWSSARKVYSHQWSEVVNQGLVFRQYKIAFAALRQLHDKGTYSFLMWLKFLYCLYLGVIRNLRS